MAKDIHQQLWNDSGKNPGKFKKILFNGLVTYGPASLQVTSL